MARGPGGRSARARVPEGSGRGHAARSRAAGARHHQRPLAGGAQPGVQPVFLESHVAGSGAPGTRAVERARRASGTHRGQVRRAAAVRRRDLGHGEPLRPDHRPHAGVPGAGHAGVGAAPGVVLPRRAVRRALDGVARLHRCAVDDRLVGRRHGPDAVHAVQLSQIRRGLRRQRPARHLAHHRRRARVDCQLSQGLRLGRRRDVGPRGEGAGRRPRPPSRNRFPGAPRAATRSAT